MTMPLSRSRMKKPNGLMRQGLRVALRTGRGRTGISLLSFVVLVAVAGPLVAPHSPTAFVGMPSVSPTLALPLGTDVLGRDVLSRLLCGGWSILWMAVAATFFGVGGGALLGISAAYIGGKFEGIVMRIADVILAFPQIVFALMLVSIAGSHLWLVVAAVGISHIPQVGRVMRAASLDVTERDYVKASALMGFPRRTILRRDILPNVSAPLMVEIGLRLTYSVIIIAGLSFLGFGIEPPAPSWGAMINENQLSLSLNAWSVVAPILMIAFLAVGVNMLTDAFGRAIGSDLTSVDSVQMKASLEVGQS